MSAVSQTLDKIFGQAEGRYLRMFAESIRLAHQYASKKWGVTVHRDRVRLNVGSVVVCTLSAGRIWFALDRDCSDTADCKYLNESDDWNWTPQYDYKAVPSMSGYYVASSPRGHSEIWARIKKMHEGLVQSAAGKYRKLRTPCQNSHSPEFLEYLRIRLDQPDLPNPSF